MFSSIRKSRILVAPLICPNGWQNSSTNVLSNSPLIRTFLYQGKVDVVMGCLGLGAPLQRSFKCLKKGGTAFVTEEINEKVLKSLQKLADQNNVKIVEKPTGSIVGTVDDLRNLLNLVAEKQVQNIYIFIFKFWRKVA